MSAGVVQNRRGISPIIATLLIVTLVVAGTAIVAILVFNMLDSDASFDVEQVKETWDYNDDGRVDAMRLRVCLATGSDDSIASHLVVRLGGTEKDWGFDPLYPVPSFSAGADTEIIVVANAVDAQLDYMNEVEIGIAVTSESILETSMHTLADQPTNPGPIVVTVTDTEGGAVVGVNVYFNDVDGFPADFPPTPTDSNGQVRAYLLPNLYSAHTMTGLSSPIFCNLYNRTINLVETGATGHAYVRAEAENGTPLTGETIEALDPGLSLLGINATTNSTGWAEFTLMAGTYVFSLEYIAHQYYSSQLVIPNANPTVTIRIDSGGLFGIACFGDYPVPKHSLTRLYTPTNSSMGMHDYTDASGYFKYNTAPRGLYRLRLDIMNKYYWSGIVSTSDPDLRVDFGGGIMDIRVMMGTVALPNGVLTRLYYPDNSSASTYDYVNNTGWAEYGARPNGDFRLRVDWQRENYFTPVFSFSGQPIITTIPGGALDIHVTVGSANLPNGVLTRLYHPDNSSCSRYDYVNNTGWAEYGATPSGQYRLRIDWMNQHTFSPIFDFDGTPVSLGLEGGDLSVHVMVGSATLPNGVLTRLYHPDNTSCSRYDYVNATGHADYYGTLAGEYRLRIDWMNQYLFTEIFQFNGTPVTVTIPGGDLVVQVMVGSATLPNGVLTRLYHPDNTSCSRYDYVNATGHAIYDGTPAGEYRLRIDWMNQYLFTEIFQFNGTPVTVTIPGNDLVVQVKVGSETLPNGVLTRLYHPDNTSCSRYDYVNASGHAEYAATPAGQYRLRIDWQRVNYWTEVFDFIADPLVVTIPGGNLTVLVTVGGAALPNGVLTRLYHPDNTSCSRYDYVNASGHAEYAATPAGQYRLRIDWQRVNYWTIVFDFTQENLTVDLPGFATLTIHITWDGSDLNGELVRLYHSDNKSCNRYDYTDSSGIAIFEPVPTGEYRIRLVYGGNHYSKPFNATDSTIEIHFDASGNQTNSFAPIFDAVAREEEREMLDVPELPCRWRIAT